MLICFVFPIGHFHDDDMIDYNYQTTNDVEFYCFILNDITKTKKTMHQNYAMETLLMYQQHPVGIKLPYVKNFFCLKKYVWLLTTSVKVIKRRVNFFPDLAKIFLSGKIFSKYLWAFKLRAQLMFEYALLQLFVFMCSVNLWLKTNKQISLGYCNRVQRKSFLQPAIRASGSYHLLAQTSYFQLAPKTFWPAELISQFLCYSNS